MAKSNVTVNVELSVPVNRTITLLVQGMFLLMMDSPDTDEYRQKLFEAAFESGHLYLPEQRGQTP